MKPRQDILCGVSLDLLVLFFGFGFLFLCFLLL